MEIQKKLVALYILIWLAKNLIFKTKFQDIDRFFSHQLIASHDLETPDCDESSKTPKRL